jgi:two-component system NtrC family response regulator
VIPTILDGELPPLIIIMTAYTDPDGAELAINSGAWDYLSKPIGLKDLKLQVIRALDFQEQKKQVTSCLTFEAPKIIGNSYAIQKCLSQASQIVCSDANVLITGETGTGKELFAKAIHENSARRNGDFIVVDCSVLSENLIESVLFGHVKGSFTGADRDRKGLVEMANGGTLFLDEVGELPESIQSSFLRVLQEKTFRPVGSEKEIFSDFRVICATNRNLENMAAADQFRSDLLYRLKTFVLELPPLRKRKEDISLIAAHQIKESCAKHNLLQKEFAPDFFETIEKYDWPGNVRELINTIETSVAAAQFEKTIYAFHLPSKIRAQIVRSKVGPKKSVSKAQPAKPMTFMELTHRRFLEKSEKKYLETVYSEMDGNISQIIERTALSRTVLYRKLKKYDIK